MRFTTAIYCFVLLLPLAAALTAADTLDIYVIDVEGGKAMVVQNPSGQTMLIDGGMAGIPMPPGMRGPSRGPDRGASRGPGRGPGRGRMPAMDPDRDKNRVAAAAKDAGITEFDVTLVTH